MYFLYSFLVSGFVKKNVVVVLHLAILVWKIKSFHLEPKFFKFLAERSDCVGVVGDDEGLVVTSHGLWGPVERAKGDQTVVDDDELVVHEKRMFIVSHNDSYTQQMTHANKQD